jgi:hypothetical protein
MSQQLSGPGGGNAAAAAAAVQPFSAAVAGPGGAIPQLWVPVAILAHAFAAVFLLKFTLLLHPGLPRKAAQRARALLAWLRGTSAGSSRRVAPAADDEGSGGGSALTAAAVVELGKQQEQLRQGGGCAGAQPGSRLERCPAPLLGRAAADAERLLPRRRRAARAAAAGAAAAPAARRLRRVRDLGQHGRRAGRAGARCCCGGGGPQGLRAHAAPPVHPRGAAAPGVARPGLQLPQQRRREDGAVGCARLPAPLGGVVAPAGLISGWLVVVRRLMRRRENSSPAGPRCRRVRQRAAGRDAGAAGPVRRGQEHPDGHPGDAQERGLLGGWVLGLGGVLAPALLTAAALPARPAGRPLRPRPPPRMHAGGQHQRAAAGQRPAHDQGLHPQDSLRAAGARRVGCSTLHNASTTTFLVIPDQPPRSSPPPRRRTTSCPP